MSAEALRDDIYTPEEYLELERKALYRSEYVNGRIYAMSGASRKHNLVTGNLFRLIGNKLVDSPCEVYTADMRVRVKQTGMYTYPDIVAVCEEPELEDTHLDTLLNPILIIETLSRSTQTYDRGDKFGHYKRLPSLREYILVAQDRILVEQYIRTDTGWTYSDYTEAEQILHIASLNFAIRLSDIYHKVKLDLSLSHTDGLLMPDSEPNDTKD